MVGDKRIFFKLNLCQRLLMKHADREMIQALGVPIGQVGALFYLLGNDGCLLKDLSLELRQNKSAITTLSERMEKNGLIRKQMSESDGRAVHLYLTDAGRSAAEKALPLVKAFNRELTTHFNDREIDTIHRFFDTIIDIYSTKEAP
ncbi:MarR family winged helix-turn-helix transcriptional regulator [Desulfatiferula olefinivorans]